MKAKYYQIENLVYRRIGWNTAFFTCAGWRKSKFTWFDFVAMKPFGYLFFGLKSIPAQDAAIKCRNTWEKVKKEGFIEAFNGEAMAVI